MKNECKNIVDYKYQLDNELKNKNINFSINPIEYGKAVMPFWQEDIHHRKKAAKVHYLHVVGGNFIDYSNQPQSIAVCNKLNASATKGYGSPSYHKVGRLSLSLAGEGKNRVELFRMYSQWIVADIKFRKYPDAETLLIHKHAYKELYYLSCSDKSFNHSGKKSK